nr:hypothetical protein [Lysobacter enzymogenes]
MDIFQWIEDLSDELREAGQYRLVELINRIPHELHENHPERVEAMLPEALAAARAMQHPWLEVFFRHWGLQNRMRNLAEGDKALPEAVSLLEFAHRDQTQQCPQSVCVTQDIAICYGNVDGPGWVPERLAVSEETLARIEPSRACYDCISREYALALMDDGRAADAVEYLQRQAQNMLRDGAEPGVAYRETQAGALFRAGRFDEALSELAAIDEDDMVDDDDGDRLSRQTFRALVLAHQGRIDEAWDALPEYGPLIVPLLYPRWSEAMALIAQAKPEYNHWRLGRLLMSMATHMDQVGAHRRCIEQALRHGELALLRNAPWSARRALELARRHQPLLRADLGAAQQIDAFAARLDAAGGGELRCRCRPSRSTSTCAAARAPIPNRTWSCCSPPTPNAATTARWPACWPRRCWPAARARKRWRTCGTSSAAIPVRRNRRPGNCWTNCSTMPTPAPRSSAWPRCCSPCANRSRIGAARSWCSGSRAGAKSADMCSACSRPIPTRAAPTACGRARPWKNRTSPRPCGCTRRWPSRPNSPAATTGT